MQLEHEKSLEIMFVSNAQIEPILLSSGMQQYENRSQIRNVTDERTDGPADRH